MKMYVFDICRKSVGSIRFQDSRVKLIQSIETTYMDTIVSMQRLFESLASSLKSNIVTHSSTSLLDFEKWRKGINK